MLYAGDLELALAESDRVVTAHTPKQVIYEFWSALKKDKERVVSAVDEFYPQLDSLLFHYLQESWPQIGDPYMRAAFFFILNRCSEAGEISTGRLSPKRFNPVSLRVLIFTPAGIKKKIRCLRCQQQKMLILFFFQSVSLILIYLNMEKVAVMR
jgi:hypothetical protein